MCDAFLYEKVILPKTVLRINTRKQADAFLYEKVILTKNSFINKSNKTSVMHFRTKKKFCLQTVLQMKTRTQV